MKLQLLSETQTLIELNMILLVEEQFELYSLHHVDAIWWFWLMRICIAVVAAVACLGYIKDI